VHSGLPAMETPGTTRDGDPSPRTKFTASRSLALLYRVGGQVSLSALPRALARHDRDSGIIASQPARKSKFRAGELIPDTYQM
jgi:hypothetical protein